MRQLASRFFKAASLILFLIPAVTQAAPSPDVPPGIDPALAYRLPRVSVVDLKVEQLDPKGGLSGTFSAQSSEEVVIDDLHYQVQILGPQPTAKVGELQTDTALEYDRVINTATFSILPKSLKVLPWEYKGPTLPSGEYRVRLRLLTSQGRALGWHDLPITFGQADTTFARIETGIIQLPADQTALPDEGVNIAPNTPIKLVSFLSTDATSTLAATPYVTVYRWGITGSKIDERALPTASLKAGEKKQLIIPVTTDTTPDAYHVVVELRNDRGDRISNYANYRYVTTGASAKVITARFDRLALRAGQQATIIAAVSGPADRETAIDTTISIAALDGSNLVKEQSLPITLDAAIQEVRASFDLPHTITTPGIRVTIKDQAGAVLDTYELHSALTPDEMARAVPAVVPVYVWVLMIVVVAISIIILIGLLWRGTQLMRAMRPLMVLLGLGVFASSAGLLSQHARAAEGINVVREGTIGQGRNRRAIVTLVVNEPRHGTTYNNNTIPVAFDMRYAACDNHTIKTFVDIDYAGNGGDFSTSTTLPNPVDLAYYEWTDLQRSGTCGPRTDVCFSSHNVFGAVTLPPHLESTTLQFNASYTVANQRDVWNIFVNLDLPNNAACNSVNIADRVTAGQQFPASIVMVNNGVKSWTLHDSTPHLLGAIGGTEGIWQTPARINSTAYPNNGVPSGTQSGFIMNVTAPTTPGTYPFTWQMVEEHRQRFGATCGKNVVVEAPPQAPAPVPKKACEDNIDNDNDGVIDSGDPGCHLFNDINQPYDPNDDDETNAIAEIDHAACLAASVPRVMNTGDTFQAAVIFRNGGNTTWTPGSAYILGSTRPYNTSLWGTHRVVLPHTVAPGQDVGIHITGRATQAGTDLPFTWQMVREGQHWFGTECGGPITVLDPVAPTAPRNPNPVTPTINQPPNARIQPIDTACVNQTLTLSGAASSDAEGPVTYHWVVRDPNGAVIVNGVTTPTVQFTTSRTGNYQVSLTVADTQGLTSVATTTIPAVNNPPQVIISTSGGRIRQLAMATATASDPDTVRCGDTISSYGWSLNFGGTPVPFDYANAQRSGISFTPQRAGVYTARAVVTDNQGAATTVEKDIQIENVPFNPGGFREVE